MSETKSTKSVYEVFYSRRPGHLIRRCQQIHVALFLEECLEYNLTPIQYSTLNVLDHIDGIEQALLAGYVALDKSTAGNVLMRLEERNLIRRESSTKDRRIKLLYLTDKGRELVHSSSKNVQRAQKLLLKPLNQEERKVFQNYLERIANYHNDKSRAPLTQLFSHKVSPPDITVTSKKPT